MEREQEKNPISGLKRKSRNIRMAVKHPVSFSLLVIYFFVPYNINEGLNSPKNYTRAQRESAFTSFPFPFRYRYLCRGMYCAEQSSNAPCPVESTCLFRLVLLKEKSHKVALRGQ